MLPIFVDVIVRARFALRILFKDNSSQFDGKSTLIPETEIANKLFLLLNFFNRFHEKIANRSRPFF